MTKGWNKYKREVKASLKCDRKLRRNLLSQLEDFKDSSGVEDGACDQFAISFGPPQEMASSLMESVSVKEIRKFQNEKKMWRFLLCIFVAVLVAGTLYIWFEKSNPVVVYDQVSVSEEIKINEKEIPK
mgnify:FL=1